MKLELLSSEPAFDLIDYESNRTAEGIIKNIIYRGMPQTADEILGLNGKKKSKRKDDKHGRI